MQSCSGYPHPNVVQHFEVLELANKKGLEVEGNWKWHLAVAPYKKKTFKNVKFC